MNHIKVVCGEIVVQVEYEVPEFGAYKVMLDNIEECVKGVLALRGVDIQGKGKE